MGNIRYCRQCGHVLSEESRFCEQCGARVERDAPTRGQQVPRRDGGLPKERQDVQNPAASARGQQMPRRDGGLPRERQNVQNPAASACGQQMPRRDGSLPRERQNVQERRTRYQQERLQDSWEESWNRELPKEDEHGITLVQYLLLGLIAVLIVALVALGLFWVKGRSGVHKTQNSQNTLSVSQTETASAAQEKESGNGSVITILDGDGQPQTGNRLTGQDGTSEKTVEPQTEKATEKATEKQTEKITEKITEANVGLPEAQNGSYILPESSERLLTDSDVDGMSYDQMQMAINEIYAMHGRKFSSQSVQSYFDGQSWYQGTIEPADFSESVFSQTEGQNIQFLLKKMGIDSN